MIRKRNIKQNQEIKSILKIKVQTKGTEILNSISELI